MEVESLELLLRVALAALAGSVVGLERELRGHPAGLRTHSLVATGAALFTVLGLVDWGVGSTGVDHTRIAAQVVTGLGFIGAGAILRDGGGGVHGLTTATTIWVSGALGVAFATGSYVLAGGALCIVLIVLVVLRVLRSAIDGIGSSVMSLEVRYDVGHGTIGPILKAVESAGATIQALTLDDTRHADRADERKVFLTVSGRRNDLSQFAELVKAVVNRPEVSGFEMYRSNE